MSEGKELNPGREDFIAWNAESPALMTLIVPDLGSAQSQFQLFSGAPHTEAGVTLHWTDLIVNEWAEWYSDMGTALARMACLARSCDQGWDLYFNDGPEGFVRWSENLFNQALCNTTRLPGPG